MEERTFFLTTIPGLESVSHLELCDKWGRASDFFNLTHYPEAKFFKGGFEFEAPLEAGLYFNSQLRTNTRMLLREKSFEAPNERAFLEGLKKIQWAQYFSKNSNFDFKFSSKSSKISMKNQVQKCLEQTFKPLKVKYKSSGTTVFVRFFRDQCSISIDCSGEAAFKRGDKTKGSIASLRESTANGLLRVLFQGVQGPFELIDPMCGSGTFLTEALKMGQSLNREFEFQKFPLTNDLKFPSGLKTSALLVPKKVYGMDISEKALKVAQKNLSQLPEGRFELKNEDLFSPSQKWPKSNGLKRIVVLNPPWGKRLPGASQDVLKAVYEKFEPDRIGFLMPSRWKVNSIPLEKTRDLAILNSGVENRFLVFA